ncbi:hypothetical protein A2U01_0074402, partial [Trifolium medium]|nr:hypothetical protein [Trifolium medium]
ERTQEGQEGEKQSHRCPRAVRARRFLVPRGCKLVSSRGAIRFAVVRQPPPKRQREDPVIGVETMEKPFPLPRCFGSRAFLEKNPPMVAAVEKSLIL